VNWRSARPIFFVEHHLFREGAKDMMDVALRSRT
jgi:hypothetical protein